MVLYRVQISLRTKCLLWKNIHKTKLSKTNIYLGYAVGYARTNVIGSRLSFVITSVRYGIH